jgi:WD domain, G-beta repeat/NB-ARC domain
MDIDEAFRTANAIIFTQKNKYLNDLDSKLFKACWQGEPFKDFASRKNYTLDHIKTRASHLWQLLSAGLGEPVNLKNFRQALERYQQTQIAVSERSLQIDWGEAPDVSFFCGRETELSTLKDWVVSDRCRAIALLGMGGIGKTTLSVKLAQAVQPEFECVIWRSLREAPPLETILDDAIDVLSNRQEVKFSLTVDRKITQLISDLRRNRCLLVLDNFEAVLQQGTHTGQYRAGYEGYGKLLRRVGESQHQSCLLMTSREKPGELATLEGSKFPVRSFRITGLQAAAQELLTATGVVGSQADQRELIQRYDGHPQALMLAATSIHELFSGRIVDFLVQETVAFNGIGRLLDEQFNRLSDLEQTILYWLAINREPVAIATLLDDIVPQPTRAQLLSSLEDLRGRCLIETASRSLLDTSAGGYTLQNVVMEYLTNQLVEKMQVAIATPQIDFFNRYALIKATAKDYVKETQVRLILNPVLVGVHDIRTHLDQILATLKTCHSSRIIYAGGNLFNLYAHLGEPLHAVDFSHLTLRQADLQKDHLHHVNFAHTAFVNCSFRQPFGFVQGVTFSPDGTRLVTGTSKGDVRVWRVADFQEIFVLRGHTKWVWQIVFSADGQSLVSCSADGTVKLWQMGAESGRCLQTLKGHTDEVYSVALSPDGQIVVSGSRDRTIKRWSVPTGECLQTIQEHTNVVCAVAFSPDGQLFASSGYDKTIKLWQSDTVQCVQTLEGHRGELSTLAFSPDGQILASGGYEFNIKLNFGRSALETVSEPWKGIPAGFPASNLALMGQSSSVVPAIKTSNSGRSAPENASIIFKDTPTWCVLWCLVPMDASWQVAAMIRW